MAGAETGDRDRQTAADSGPAEQPGSFGMPVSGNIEMPETLDSPNSGQPAEKSHLFREIIESVVIAVILAVLIKVFLIQNFIIPSGSMEPTLKKGDMIYINKMVYRLEEPKRGDIVVFRYPVDPKRDFVKRLIGMPGETIQIRETNLYINDKLMTQPFLPEGLKYPDYGPYRIKEGEFFMMGDNRPNSSDSRVWGTVPRANFIGRAMFIYWPLERVRALK